MQVFFYFQVPSSPSAGYKKRFLGFTFLFSPRERAAAAAAASAVFLPPPLRAGDGG